MEWPRRILGALGVGLLWTVIWAAVGALLGMVAPRGSIDALWLGPAIGMQPGLLAGAIFVVVLGIASGGRRLVASSLPKAAACGGLAGLLVGALPFAINEPPSEVALWRVGLVVIGSMTILGTLSAAGSLALARATAGRR